jgi:hypothetical protein
LNPLTPPVVLAADAVIDLQMHTIFSDGTWTPEQLIDYLVNNLAWARSPIMIV